MQWIFIVQMYGAVRSGEDSIIVIWLRLLAMVIVTLHSTYTPKSCDRKHVSSIFPFPFFS